MSPLPKCRVPLPPAVASLLGCWGFSYVESLSWVLLGPGHGVLRLPCDYAARSHITLYIFRRDGAQGGAYTHAVASVNGGRDKVVAAAAVIVSLASASAVLRHHCTCAHEDDGRCTAAALCCPAKLCSGQARAVTSNCGTNATQTWFLTVFVLYKVRNMMHDDDCNHPCDANSRAHANDACCCLRRRARVGCAGAGV